MVPFAREILFSSLLVMISFAAFAADKPAGNYGTLDGLSFVGETGEQGKGDHHKDVISFKDGKFRSTDCENWGFTPAPYTMKKDGDSYQFTSTLKSPDLGRLEWKGTVIGEKATATFRWIHKRWWLWTIERDYWFKGTLQSGQQ